MSWDQRGGGYPRIVNGVIDIGAFEYQGASAAARVGRPAAALVDALFQAGPPARSFAVGTAGAPALTSPPSVEAGPTTIQWPSVSADVVAALFQRAAQKDHANVWDALEESGL